MTYGKPLKDIKTKNPQVEQVVDKRNHQKEEEPAEEKQPQKHGKRKGDKPVEKKVSVQEGVEGKEKKSNRRTDKPVVGDIPAETVSDSEVANAPTEHKDGTTTPPTGDDHKDFKATAGKAEEAPKKNTAPENK